jgi:mannose-1-phosphate guanylyltransferase
VKAFLLAAGEGRRLHRLTDSLPKCLVSIRGTPLLAIWLRLLEAHGITHALINVHHLHHKVVAFLASSPTPVRVSVVHEPELLGSAGTVLLNRGFVKDDDAFLIIYADTLTTIDLRKMISFHAGRCEPITMGVAPTDTPRQKGIVVIDSDDRVIEFAEKPAEPRSNMANAGIYVAGQRIFEAMPGALEKGRLLDFGSDVLPRLVPHVAAYAIREFLIDIGTPAAYELAQKTWPGLPSTRHERPDRHP